MKLLSLEPESSASANSAMPACVEASTNVLYYTALMPICQELFAKKSEKGKMWGAKEHLPIHMSGNVCESGAYLRYGLSLFCACKTTAHSTHFASTTVFFVTGVMCESSPAF